jgi:hypothetical protein
LQKAIQAFVRMVNGVLSFERRAPHKTAPRDSRDNLVYGVLLVVFIIFLPKGILGSI